MKEVKMTKTRPNISIKSKWTKLEVKDKLERLNFKNLIHVI